MSDQFPLELVELLDELTEKYNSDGVVDLDSFIERQPQHEDQIRRLAGSLEAMAQLRAQPDNGFSDVPSDEDKPTIHALGDFKLIREIGRGGMGIVYEAEQLSLGRRVAVKVFPYAVLLDQRQLDRFKNEARAAAMLKHPNIVPVHFVGCERGIHFYVMDLIDGTSLASVTRAEAHTSKQGSSNTGSSDTSPMAAMTTKRDSTDRANQYRNVAKTGVQVGRALHYAHCEGVIHRDIKPSNLLIDREGQVYLSDFGLARIETSEQVTVTGDLLGTLRYMSPEQASDAHGLTDHRSDIYSLGVTLYELLAGRPAFVGDNRQRLLTSIENERPTRLRHLDSRIPIDLEKIISKATEKEPYRRYETAAEFADDLDRFLEQRPVRARQTNQFYYVYRWARRNRWLAASLMVTILLLCLVAIAGPLIAIQQTRVASETTANLYVQSIGMAAEALRTGKQEQARILLDQYKPTRGAVDLRGFEWYMLRRQCHTAEAITEVRADTPAWEEGGSVRCVAFSPNDESIAFGLWSSLVRIIRAETGAQQCRLEPNGKVTSVAFFDDSEHVVVGTESGEVRIWNTTTGTEIPVDDSLRRPKLGAIYCVEFSPDGRWLAAGSGKNVVHLWPVSRSGSGPVLGDRQELPHSGGVFGIRFFPTAKLIATVGAEGLRIWETDALEPVGSEPSFLHATAVAIAQDQAMLAIGNQDGTVGLFTFEDNDLKKCAQFVASSGAVTRLEFLPHQRVLVSAGRDGKVAFWDTSERAWQRASVDPDHFAKMYFNPMGWAQLVTLSGHVGLAVSNDGKRIATGGPNGTLKVWDTDQLLKEAVPRRLVNQHNNHWDLRFSPRDSNTLVSVGERGACQIWNVQKGTATDGAAMGIATVDVSPDGQRIAIGQGTWPFSWTRARKPAPRPNSGSVEIMGIDGSHVKTLTGHDGMVMAVRFSPRGRHLVSAGYGGRVKIWQLDSRQAPIELPRTSTPVFSVDVSADGRLVAVGTGDGTVEIWKVGGSSLPEMAFELEAHDDWVSIIEFSPTESLLASASMDGTAMVWDLDSRECVHILRHGSWVLDAAFSADGKTLATCGNDRWTRLWNVRTGGELLQLGGHSSWVTSVAFSSDGRFLVTGSHDHSILLWSAGGF